MRVNIDEEKGHAFIELAIVLPVLLGIAIVGLDLARSLQIRQIATALSREAASMAYRDCSAETETDGVEDCLEGVRAFIANRSNNVVDTSQIIIAMYDGQSGSVSRGGRVGDSADVSRSRIQYSDSPIVSGTPLGDAILSHEVVVTAEIFITFQPVIVGVLPLSKEGGFSLGGAYEIYDATIM